jgi:hypothetical protein
MPAFQATGINGPELDAPRADGFATDGDTSFSEKVFNIPMTQIEAIIEPDGVGDDIGREPVTLVSSHAPILSISAS